MRSWTQFNSTELKMGQGARLPRAPPSIHLRVAPPRDLSKFKREGLSSPHHQPSSLLAPRCNHGLRSRAGRCVDTVASRCRERRRRAARPRGPRGGERRPCGQHTRARSRSRARGCSRGAARRERTCTWADAEREREGQGQGARKESAPPSAARSAAWSGLERTAGPSCKPSDHRCHRR